MNKSEKEKRRQQKREKEIKRQERKDREYLMFSVVLSIFLVVRAFVIGEHIIRDVLLAVLYLNFAFIVTGKGLSIVFIRLYKWNIIRKKDMGILDRLRYIDYFYSKDTVKEKERLLNHFPYLKEKLLVFFNWSKKGLVRGYNHRNDYMCFFTSKKLTFKCKLRKNAKRKLGSKSKIRKTQRSFTRQLNLDMYSFNSIDEYFERISFEFEKHIIEIDNAINHIIDKK